MFYKASILTDKEIDVFEKGFDGPVVSADKDLNAVGTLNEMDFIVVSNREYIAPSDVVSAWKQVKDDKFEAYHKRASWVWKCLNIFRRISFLICGIKYPEMMICTAPCSGF